MAEEVCPNCGEKVGAGDTLADHQIAEHRARIDESIESREPSTPTERVRRRVDEAH